MHSNYSIFCMGFLDSHIRRPRVRHVPPLEGVRLGEPSVLLGNCWFAGGWLGSLRLHVSHVPLIRGLLDHVRVLFPCLPPWPLRTFGKCPEPVEEGVGEGSSSPWGLLQPLHNIDWPPLVVLTTLALVPLGHEIYR